MKLFLRLTLLASTVPVLILAGDWSGTLVDADCYNSAQNNTKAGTHPGSTDISRTLRSCAPKDNTSSFAVVQHDGTSINLDSAGNQKARELIQSGAKKPYRVNVTGDKPGDTIQVTAISTAK